MHLLYNNLGSEKIFSKVFFLFCDERKTQTILCLPLSLRLLIPFFHTLLYKYIFLIIIHFLDFHPLVHSLVFALNFIETEPDFFPYPNKTDHQGVSKFCPHFCPALLFLFHSLTLSVFRRANTAIKVESR